MQEACVKRPMTNDRRNQITELMQQRGAMRVAELAGMFGVSEVTIRTDLAQLERAGQLVRDRGGALPAANPAGEAHAVHSLLALGDRAGLYAEEKRRIGQAAASMVEPGDTIILDAGTTVVEMTSHLAAISPLTVVTNALNVALHMASAEADLMVLGGTLNRQAASTIGPMAEAGLNDLIVGKLFLGAQAWSLEEGVTDTTLEIAQIKRAMMRAARQVILLADSSKWNHAGFIKVAPLAEVHTIITDSGLPPDARAALRSSSTELILA